MESKAWVHVRTPSQVVSFPAEQASGLHDSRRGVRVLILVASGHGIEKNEGGHLVRSDQTRFRRSLGRFVSGGARARVVIPLPIRQGRLLGKSLGWGSWDSADLCAGSRGWEGCCVWDFVPLSQRCPGIPLSPRPLIGLEFWAKV